MKKTILVLTVLMASLGFAQNSHEKTIGDFKELKVYDLIEVELVRSDENKAIITGKNTQDVVINNKNGILKIKMNIGKIFNGSDTKVTLYYKSLDVIDANEGAKIYSTDVIKQFEINLKVQEGASIQIPLQVSYTNAKAVSGGSIKTKGVSKSQKIALLTGGLYQGEELETTTTEVSINAAGEAHVKASKLVDAKIRAGGDVYVYGHPETINENTALGGRIKKMD